VWSTVSSHSDEGTRSGRKREGEEKRREKAGDRQQLPARRCEEPAASSIRKEEKKGKGKGGRAMSIRPSFVF